VTAACGVRTLLVLFVLLCTAAASASHGGSGPADAVSETRSPTGRSWRIYDNGPYVTHWGSGAGGANASVVQFSIGLTAYGFVHKAGTIDLIADDFVVPEGWEWIVEAVTFFSYEPYGSTSPSTVNWVSFIMWDAAPNSPESDYVFGDFYTNRLTTSVWTGCYRVGEGTGGSTMRPIMANTCVIEPPLVLPAGNYWMVWQTEGTKDFGPYSPPVTVLGLTDTGDALISETGGLTWEPASDNHHRQGFPFYLTGTTLDTAVEPVSWGAVKAMFR
jgi:hypothetical protein